MPLALTTVFADVPDEFQLQRVPEQHLAISSRR